MDVRSSKIPQLALSFVDTYSYRWLWLVIMRLTPNVGGYWLTHVKLIWDLCRGSSQSPPEASAAESKSPEWAFPPNIDFLYFIYLLPPSSSVISKRSTVLTKILTLSRTVECGATSWFTRSSPAGGQIQGMSSHLIPRRTFLEHWMAREIRRDVDVNMLKKLKFKSNISTDAWRGMPPFGSLPKGNEWNLAFRIRSNVIDFLRLCLTRVSGYASVKLSLSVSQCLCRTVWVTYKSIYLISLIAISGVKLW